MRSVTVTIGMLLVIALLAVSVTGCTRDSPPTAPTATPARADANPTPTAAQAKETPTTPADQIDRAALEALYHATDGRNWKSKANWLSSDPLEWWHGVTTDGGGRVTGLRLEANGLRGPIPPELGDMANLTSLYLHSNALSGPIPPELGDLTNLKWLSFARNGLSGPIPPELGNLGQLWDLDLSENGLSGPIPPELGDLVNLQMLTLTCQPDGDLPARQRVEWSDTV